MQIKQVILLTFPALVVSSSITPRTFGSWTIRNFSRSCPDPKSCLYDLIISTPSGDQPCTIVDNNLPTALNHSFYGIACSQSASWQLSWGWDYPQNFTVITAVHILQPSTANLRAFFGYSSPNSNILHTGGNATYPDAGPSAVQQEL